MQKKVIALAVAGLVSGAAFAQSNVTIYGVADAFYGYTKGENADFGGINGGGWNGNRVGFKGEEGLGNGLKAIFTYEFGTDIDGSTLGLTNTRLSFVGLSGNFGSATLGKQAAPSYSYIGATSSNDITTVFPTNMILGKVFPIMNSGGGSRWDNSIAYNSPVVSGFQGKVIYSFGEKVTTLSDQSDAGKFGIGGAYTNGPLYLTAMYHEQAKDESVATAIGKEKSWAVGGNYDFKVVKLWANYLDGNDKRTFKDADKNLWSVGLSAPIAKAGTLMFEYTKAKVEESGAKDQETDGYGIGYRHDLSKRTWLYTTVSRMSNDNWKLGGTGLAAGTVTANDDNTNFAIGLRHGF